MEPIIPSNDKDVDIYKIIERLEQICRMINKDADKRIKAVPKQQKQNYDRKQMKNKFEIGDKVWRFNTEYAKGTKKKSLKKGHRWFGPFTFIGVTSTGNYHIYPEALN